MAASVRLDLGAALFSRLGRRRFSRPVTGTFRPSRNISAGRLFLKVLNTGQMFLLIRRTRDRHERQPLQSSQVRAAVSIYVRDGAPCLHWVSFRIMTVGPLPHHQVQQPIAGALGRRPGSREKTRSWFGDRKRRSDIGDKALAPRYNNGLALFPTSES